VDPINQPTTINSNTGTQVAGNSLAADYLVTQKIDPSSIPQNQLEKDLEMFKKAEEKLYSKTPEYIKITKDVRSKTLPSKPLTEVDILRIKNPFRGE